MIIVRAITRVNLQDIIQCENSYRANIPGNPWVRHCISCEIQMHYAKLREIHLSSYFISKEGTKYIHSRIYNYYSNMPAIAGH